MDYQQFLQSKKLHYRSTGFQVERSQVNPKLFDYQKDIVQVACQKGCYALFAECGLGKSFMQLEWARLVSEHNVKRVLILAPLAVTSQTVLEAKKLGIGLTYCRTAQDVLDAPTSLVISNYEMLDKLNTNIFSGVVLDESSILKNFTGKTKQKLVKAFEETQYKLCCTATPAPNDYLELGNHAEFLGIMPSNEMIMRWFINDTMHAGGYRLKNHAAKDFWRWVTSWSVCISKPSDIGYSDDGFQLPPLNIETHRVEVDHTQAWSDFQDAKTGQISMFMNNTASATGIWKQKKLTLNERLDKAADLVSQNYFEKWIVWVDTNEEADYLMKKTIVVEVRGSDKIEEKERKLKAFTSEDAWVIITKAEIAGLGLNWQHCHNMIFVGSTFSYERFHQAVRRCYRFGQKSTVNVHLIMSETEENVVQAIERKRQAFVEMQSAMCEAMRENGLFQNSTRRTLVEYVPCAGIDIPSWLRSKVLI